MEEENVHSKRTIHAHDLVVASKAFVEKKQSLPYIQPTAPKEHFDRAEKPEGNLLRFSKRKL